MFVPFSLLLLIHSNMCWTAIIPAISMYSLRTPSVPQPHSGSHRRLTYLHHNAKLLFVSSTLIFSWMTGGFPKSASPLVLSLYAEKTAIVKNKNNMPWPFTKQEMVTLDQQAICQPLWSLGSHYWVTI